MILDTRPTRNLALELVRVTEAAPWQPAGIWVAATKMARTALLWMPCA